MTSMTRDVRHRRSGGQHLGRGAVAALLGALAIVSAAPLRAQQVGTASGLPVPRYVSLKSDHVNLREGPSKEHRTLWIYQRAGLPVEITAEFETWRKIRDSEGTEGWVLHSLLSGRRTALVIPWKKDTFLPLRASAADTAGVAANLQSGVVVNVKRCDGSWCRVFGDNFDGYVQQTSLWGVYPDEHVE